MQLMPGTAHFVARTTQVRYNNRRKRGGDQPDPGPRRPDVVENAKINGGLFLMLAAWGADRGSEQVAPPLSDWTTRCSSSKACHRAKPATLSSTYLLTSGSIA